MYHRLFSSVLARDENYRNLVGTGFLPLDAMNQAITVPSIAAQQPSEQNKRVIGLLGLLEEEGTIPDVLHEGLTDQHLPLKRKKKTGPITLVSDQGDKEFKSFARWKSSTVNNLIHDQWKVLAPAFTTRGKHITIHQKTPLPVYDIKIIPYEGYGTIHTARLRAAHLIPTPEWDPKVAIKSYSGESGEHEFTKEIANLREVQDLNHPHLIQHIATVEQGLWYYVIFHWADGGNLSDFWRCGPDSPDSPDPCDHDAELFKWSFQQMLGLVEALVALYDAGCRHGDLKPMNILHFKESDDPAIPHSTYGRLVITDFGISKFHAQATGFRRMGTNTTISTPGYEAPEAELDRNMPEDKKKPRSRKYDMWSIGCIYTEFIIWLLYGHQTIEDFRKIREKISSKAAYYTVTATAKHAEIHPAVSSGLQALREDPRCTKENGLADLISLIENNLIVIDPEKRATPEKLRDKLREILRDDNYGLLTKGIELPPSVPDAFRPG
ncbi:kinase-like protein [Nemania serpens]|nr:kinase-like protein [Nemania serpens]